MTVLVLTAPEDVTADMVIDHLGRMAVPVLRVDPADYPTRIDLTARFTGGRMTGAISTGNRQVDLGDIRSIWVRRPGEPRQEDTVQPAWLALESERAWYGALRALAAGTRWLNHPDAQGRCRYKPWQLVLADTIGFPVPDTVITTRPGDARRFAAECGPVVCKSISGRAPDGFLLPTTLLPEDADYTAVTGSPTCLQTLVDKAYEVRLTVIGRRMFCARTEPYEPGLAVLDWRYEDPDHIRWRAMDTPAAVVSKVRDFMRLAELSYGAFDFAVDDDGTWYFLECNAGGQFGFVELATGLPIARAIAEWLAHGE